MRKIFSLVLVLLMIAGFSVCQATISADSLNAGGVYVGQSMSDVVSIYGQPTSKFKEDGNDNLQDTYTWKNEKIGLAVLFFRGIAYEIRVSNGISTPDGIHAGMSVSDVKRVLGTPDKETEPNKAYRMRQVLDYRDSTKVNGILFVIENGVVNYYKIFGKRVN